MRLFKLFTLTACVLMTMAGVRAAGTGSLLTGLRIDQAITPSPAGYEAKPGVRVRFTLSAPAEVTVRIDRHLATSQQNQSEYLADPIPVRTLKLGRRNAGEHTVEWDGLNDKGQPVRETQVVAPRNVTEKPRESSLTRQVPVDLFRVSVLAGSEQAAANFRRLEGAVDSSRSLRGFNGAVRTRSGAILVADRALWRGRAFTGDWHPEGTFPKGSGDQTSDPVGAYDVAEDTQGNRYLMAPAGIFRYAATGEAAPWSAKAEYINYPYEFPGVKSNTLGVRLERAAGTEGVGAPAAANPADPAGLVKKPGFAYQWGGLALDAQDNLYLGRVDPEPQIQVFDGTGKFLRALPLPADVKPLSLRMTADGHLWVAGGGSLVRLNRETGAVEKVEPVPADYLHLGPDGSLYAVSGGQLWRYSSAGDALPFTAQAPYVRGEGRLLDLRPAANGVPDGTPGFARAIRGVVGGPQGDFYLSVADSEAPDAPGTRLLHFGADAGFLPETFSAALGQHRPGNVFVGGEPAVLELFLNNLQENELPLTAHWTLTDFDGKETEGTTEFSAPALTREREALVVNAPEFGHYRLEVTLRQGDRTLAVLDTQMARLRERRLIREDYSPFGMCWGTNFHLMGLAGVKHERVGSAYWGKIEPYEGITMPDPPEAVQWPESLAGYRRYAAKNTIQVPEGFSYGEPWLGGSFPACRIYSYDRFYNYSMRVVDRFASQDVPYYQFWNEPNFFWRVPGNFSREHFALVAKHTWSIVKARDKDSLAICDGDAGSTRMMEELAQYGANDYNDTVQIHYPSSQPLKWGETILKDLPEGRVPMVLDLMNLRDRHYPGKPVWNTEEGWWGAKQKSPEIGARVVPRLYIPQIAAGVERIYWFAQSSADDPTYLLDGDSAPYPSYPSYATMTRLLEGSDYIGAVELGPFTFGYLFGQSNSPNVVLAAWSVQGEHDVAIEAGVDKATLYDLMDRKTDLAAVDGKLPLKLTERVQYLVLPRGSWSQLVGKGEMERKLRALNLADPAALEADVAAMSRAAVNDARAYGRLYYLLRAAQHVAWAGEAPQVEGGTSDRVAASQAHILKREGPEGYLRRARTVQGWAGRLLRSASRQIGAVSGGLAWAATLASQSATTLANLETPEFPGAVVNAYLQPRSVRETTPPNQPLDEKFAFEITQAPGSTFDLELTVWNYYRRPIAGVMMPRLPDGWKPTPERAAYAVAPGKFERYVFKVQVPPGTKAGVYPVGGLRMTAGQTAREIHTQRVRVGQ